jgi:hypothetical protein
MNALVPSKNDCKKGVCINKVFRIAVKKSGFLQIETGLYIYFSKKIVFFGKKTIFAKTKIKAKKNSIKNSNIFRKEYK